MQHNDLKHKVRQILKRETRYRKEAYFFIGHAVTFTIGRLKKTRHISAEELLQGAVDYGLVYYGPFYEDIFKNWGIKTGADIGRIVYELIKEQALAANDGDSIEDFATDFDLFAAANPKLTPYDKKVETID